MTDLSELTQWIKDAMKMIESIESAGGPLCMIKKEDRLTMFRVRRDDLDRRSLLFFLSSIVCNYIEGIDKYYADRGMWDRQMNSPSSGMMPDDNSLYDREWMLDLLSKLSKRFGKESE